MTTTKVGYITVATGMCLVPSLNGVRFNNAEAIWQGAPYNFTGVVIRGTGAPNGNFIITAQNLTGGTMVAVQQRHHGEPAMSLRRRTRTASSRRTRGQALVEFALVIPLFLLMLVALFDLGRAVFAYNTLTNAAREGARLAIVNQDLDSIIDRAKSSRRSSSSTRRTSRSTSGRRPTTARPIRRTRATSWPTNCLAVVRFEATYRPITPFISNILFGNGVTFVATSVLPVEYRCPNTHYPTANLCPKQP